MFKLFCFKKLSYCHQNIFLIACIQPGVVLKLLLILDNLNLTVLRKCVLTKKKCIKLNKECFPSSRID